MSMTAHERGDYAVAQWDRYTRDEQIKRLRGDRFYGYRMKRAKSHRTISRILNEAREEIRCMNQWTLP